MAVTLTISESIGGAEVSDSLAGGGTGVDLGQVVNGLYSPIIDANTNTGAQVLYLRHNAVIDPITDLSIYMDSYARTGFTYGGASTAASDYSALKTEGDLSDVSLAAKNNSNGLASGLWMEMQYDVSTTNQFDIYSTRAGSELGSKFVKIFGKSNEGIDESTSYGVIKEACLFANGVNEDAPVSPVDGKIGISGDSTLGDYAKLRFRIYLREAFVDGGVFQAALVARFSYTA